MHKKLIKRKTPTYFGGGEFLKGGGLGNVFKGFTGQSITGKNGLPPTEAEMLNGSIGGGIMAGFKSAGNLLDIGNSNMNAAQKDMATADGAVEGIAGVASAFGPVGSAVGMGLNLVNSLGGKLMGAPKAVKDYSINESVSSSSAFGGVNENASQAGAGADSYKNAGLAGKLFGKKKVMNKINDANNLMTQTAKVLDTNKQALATASQSADMFSARNNFKLNSGNMFTNGSVQFGQKGLKISKDCKLTALTKASKSLNLKKIKKEIKKNIPLLKEMEDSGLINSKIEPLIVVVEGNNEPQYFKEGGTIENKNIIADGVLHARKHDLKEGEFKNADITLKGIPVITKDADGGIIQHAEIEKDELILHLNLTKELEELYKIGDEESMISAGKILSKELVKNTKDSKSKILKNA